MRCLLSTLLLGWTAAAHAIVDIEAMRVGESPQGYSGTLNASITGESGYTDKISTSSGARLQWHSGIITNFAIFRYDYAETSGVSDTNYLLLHVRHIHEVTKKTAYEGFMQAERNEFARLSFRGLIGGGVRLTLNKMAGVKSLHLGLGGFYSHEKLTSEPGTTDSGIQNLWRLSTYLNYVRQFNEQVKMLSTTYYQPALEDFGDYRMLEEASLSVKMTDTLNLKLSLDLTHDSRPPQTVKKTDIIYSTGVEYSF